ncbi:MAG: hypothetical protein HY686_08075 [Chloroflexi bacterium]|nr:hypothetical protein [Chloroflexota bacterium]
MNGSSSIELFQNMLDKRLQRMKELEEEMRELKSEIDSIQHTYTLHKKEMGIPDLAQAPLLEHGLSLTKRRAQALIQWAERNNGILIPKEAKKALIAAGLLRAGKGAGWIVYGTITNMDCWEKIQPGKYRLQQPKVLKDEFGRSIGRLTPTE